MHIALIYPPTCDPTAPYLSVPALTGYLRSRGVTVTPIDANLEAYKYWLSRPRLEEVAGRVERRLAKLERKPYLSHVEQRSLGALWAALGDALEAPGRIEQAVAKLRDPVQFFDRAAYGEAVDVVEAALRAISAAYAPLELSFTAYRTPFSLLTPEEILADARPERDPFYATEMAICDRLAKTDVTAVGLSVVFPGQVQPAYSFAVRLRERFGERVHLTIGGPALTQLLVRKRDDAAALARMLGPFDSAVCFEGEVALYGLLEALAGGRSPKDVPNVIVKGHPLASQSPMQDLTALPSPDFDGLPLGDYFSPGLVLPYDPTRGCYWGVCTFCHYGLAEKGTAPYRERTVPQMIEHLSALSQRHATPYFYFSQDSVAPKTLLHLAEGLIDAKLALRWATDLKPEKYMTAERAEVLRKGGAVACALGVESAAPRVLSLIDKGAPIETVANVMDHLAGADIAVEAMCFTEFPTETFAEAMATVKFLERHDEAVSLFIMGEFDLTPGSVVAQQPQRFGLVETWQVAGDELGIGLFYRERKTSKNADELERLDGAVDQLADRYTLRRYPWAGSLSTAHTLLYYERYGSRAFRPRATTRSERPSPEPRNIEAGARYRRSRFAVERLLRDATLAEQEIWQRLIYELRLVGRAKYRELADALPALTPLPFAAHYRVALGKSPTVTNGRSSRRKGRRVKAWPHANRGRHAQPAR